MPKSISEIELIQLLKSQQKEGFDLLYENYSPILYSIICKKVGDTTAAEDILQETFVKIWKKIGQYDHDKGKLYTWMLRVARNTCIDYIRSHDYKYQQMVKTNEDGALHLAEKKIHEMDFGLKALVKKLEPKHREVIETIFFGSFTYDEAAKELCIPLGTLKTRARTALLLLRGALPIGAQF